LLIKNEQKKERNRSKKYLKAIIIFKIAKNIIKKYNKYIESFPRVDG
jgi:hypothetical protein